MSAMKEITPPYELRHTHPFAITPADATAFGDYQKQANLHFTPQEPLSPSKVPWYVPKIKSVDDALSALKEATTPVEQQKILDRLHPDVRRSPEDMLKIVSKYAGALPYASPEIVDKDFLVKAVAKKSQSLRLVTI